jgi:hypothetical protein
MFRVYYYNPLWNWQGPFIGPFWHVRATGVVTIGIDEPKGRKIIDKANFYVYTDEMGWRVAHNDHDIIMNLDRWGMGPGGVRCILSGIWCPDEEYLKILEKAKTDKFG